MMLGHALLLGGHLMMTTLTWAGQSQRAQLQAGLQASSKTRRSTRTLFDVYIIAIILLIFLPGHCFSVQSGTIIIDLL